MERNASQIQSDAKLGRATNSLALADLLTRVSLLKATNGTRASQASCTFLGPGQVSLARSLIREPELDCANFSLSNCYKSPCGRSVRSTNLRALRQAQ